MKEPKPLINRIIGGILMTVAGSMYVLEFANSFLAVRNLTGLEKVEFEWYKPLVPLVAGALFYFRLNLFISTSASAIGKVVNFRTGNPTAADKEEEKEENENDLH
jgi:hypothetical protein